MSDREGAVIDEAAGRPTAAPSAGSSWTRRLAAGWTNRHRARPSDGGRQGGPVPVTTITDPDRAEEFAALLDRLARTRKAARGPAHQDAVARARRALDLDRVAATAAGLRPSRRLRVEREPLTMGRSSRLLNRVRLSPPRGAEVELVEKGIESSDGEVRFWSAPPQHLVAAGEGFECLRPLHVLVAGPLAVMHLPYREDVRRPIVVADERFPVEVVDLARGVAAFNAANPPGAATPPGDHPFLARWERPTVDRLREVFAPLSEPEAEAVQRRWDRIASRIDPLLDRLRRLPHHLAHFDVGPGNAVLSDGRAVLLDLGHVGTAPLGTDLHALVRSSGRLSDPAGIDELVTAYLDGVDRVGTDVERSDVELACWLTFFLRYGSFSWKSARHPEVFSLALDRAEALLDAHLP